MLTITKTHEIACAHRIVGHAGKCANLHGHNYIIELTLRGPINDLGMIMDFGGMGKLLCYWLDDNWDHKVILWDKDPIAALVGVVGLSTVIVPFNPTVENMAHHFLHSVAPAVLRGYPQELCKIVIYETSKCSATCEVPNARGN